MALSLNIIMISINLQDKAFGVPALAGILKAIILTAIQKSCALGLIIYQKGVILVVKS